MTANQFTDGWCGEASAYYRQRIEAVWTFHGEINPTVRGWAEDYIRSLERHLDRAMDEEERDGV